MYKENKRTYRKILLMNSSFTENLSDEEKIIFLEILAFVLNSGRALSSAQNNFLKTQAWELGIDEQQFKKISKIKRSETAANALLKIRDVRLRRYFIREIIMLAISDHELTDVEMCNIYKIGCAVGIKEDKINDFFLWAAQGVEWQLEGIRMVEDDL